MLKNKKILCIGPSDKLVTGQYKSFKLTSKLLGAIVIHNDFSNIFGFVLYYFNLLKVSAFSNLDVIYFTNSRTRLGFYARDLILIALFPSRKLIYHLHGNDFHLFYNTGNLIDRFFVRYFYKKINSCITPSDIATAFIKDNLNGSLNVYSIPNVPDDLVYDPSYKTKTKTTLLFFSNITVDKGILDFLDLVRILNIKNAQRFDFHVVGKLIDDFVFTSFDFDANNVFFHGPIYDKYELSRILSSTDIHFFPSTYATELYPICLIESALCNNYVISNRIGAVDELLSGMQSTIYDDYQTDKSEICDIIMNFKSSNSVIENNIIAGSKFCIFEYQNKLFEAINGI